MAFGANLFLAKIINGPSIGKAALRLPDAVCCHGLVPRYIQGVLVASALGSLDENNDDCNHRDQRQWGHRLSLLVMTDFA